MSKHLINTCRLSLLACALATLSSAQATPLYLNVPLVNAQGESVLVPPDNTLGVGAQTSSGNSVADDFTVPLGQVWRVSSLSLFGYQTGATSFTFTAANWSIVTGDVNAGVVLASGSGAVSDEGLVGYRVTDTTLGTTQRPIFQIGVDIPDIDLTAGSYWLRWDLSGSGASGPWVPPVQGAALSNAQQALSAGAFNPWLDTQSQRPGELPFALNGTVPEPTSLALVLAAGLAAVRASRRRAV